MTSRDLRAPEGKPALRVASPQPSQHQAPPERLHGYRILGELGRGGMSTVYRARQSRMDREVALKVLDPVNAADEMMRHRFVREGQMGARVSHTNVVTHYDLREDRGWFYLAMELVPGGTLRELLKRHKWRMPERLALGMCRDVACGLEAVARAGVVHRDIKPANIFMTTDMVPKIADFGVAIAAAAGLQRKDVERKRRIVIGSPRYMPPEQANPKARLDVRADIHALGATLWELLFGATPYQGEDVRKLLVDLVNGPVPDPRRQEVEVSEATAAILERCLAKGTEDRFQTPRELVAAIDGALHGDDQGSAKSATAPSGGLPFTWTGF